MPSFLHKFVDRMVLWSIRGSVKSRFDGIGLADMRGDGDSFSNIIQASLRLIQEQDPRRYARVKQHIAWITNQINNAMGAQYEPSIRTLFLEFDEAGELQLDVVIAHYACIIVHEATHGLIDSRGIKMSTETAVRIERLCTAEQNRFAVRLSARDPARYPSVLLQHNFDARYWEPEWKKGGGERASSFAKHWLHDRKTG
jgi:hypothetical protein